MSAQPARGYLSISEVLAQLRADFPDVSISKIRFLETEGLIEPARSPSGYRRFDGADVERLRYILTAQRDQYLPLRVIRERLGAPGGQPSAGPPPAGSPATALPATGLPATGLPATGLPATGLPATGPGELLSRRELLDRAGITEPQLTELESFGLLRREGRLYTADALEVARAAAALSGFGVQARHLRAIRAAVERETTLIEDVVAPILRQRGSGAREQAARTAAELAGLAVRLHRALIDGALAEAGLAAPPRPGCPGGAAGSAVGGAASAVGRGTARDQRGASA